MSNPIVGNVLAPLATRGGVAVTGYLIGLGANEVHADWVGTGIAGALLIGVDLMLAWFRKRAIQSKAHAAAIVQARHEAARMAWVNVAGASDG